MAKKPNPARKAAKPGKSAKPAKPGKGAKASAKPDGVAPPQGGKAATAKDIEGMPSPKTVRALLKIDRDLSIEGKEVSGRAGNAIKAFVDKYGINRDALAVLRKFNKIGRVERLAEAINHLDYLLDVSGLFERAQAVERLPLGDSPADETEADDADAADAPEVEPAGEPEAKAETGDNVTRPRFGAKTAA